MVIPPILAFRDALRLEKQGVEINPANVLGFYLIGGTIWFFVMCMVSLGVIYFGVCGDSGECYNFRTLAPTLAILVGAYIALPFFIYRDFRLKRIVRKRSDQTSSKYLS